MVLHSKPQLFLTLVHASFVNREVAAWIGQHAGRATRLGARKRKMDGDSNTSVSLAGTSLSSPILGSVVFDLTFLNEVTRQHDTIKDIHVQVIDSCIAVIIGRPRIRSNHLVQKIPLYLDEIPSSKPYLSQPVVPVTTPVTSGAKCRGSPVLDVGAED